MQNKNLGLILYTKCIKDNDLYIKILSNDDKILSGLVYGGNSSKKKLIYQPGYIIEFNKLQKNVNSVSSVNGELSRPYIGNIYKDKFKSFSLLAIISILNICLYDGVKTNGIFISVKELINHINTNNQWLSNFCYWLLYLLKLLGYEIEYKNKKNLKYFNLRSLKFENINISTSSILFPHELLKNNETVKYESVNSVFTIFETVFKQYHLNNNNDKMPLNYLNFKKIIINKLHNINT